MTTLFSIAFTGIFITFIIAAVLGHVLLIEAVARPFLARLAVAARMPVASNLQPVR